MASKIDKYKRRAFKVRKKLKAAANGKPRLSIYRSNKNIYAQIIDDAKGATIVSASTVEKGADRQVNISSAAKVGENIAQRAKKAGVEEVVFDRGAFLYHGKVKALADAAREKGLKF